MTTRTFYPGHEVIEALARAVRDLALQVPAGQRTPEVQALAASDDVLDWMEAERAAERERQRVERESLPPDDRGPRPPGRGGAW